MDGQNKRKLGKNFVYNFLSQVLVLAIPLITAPYLARVLGEIGNGQYSYSSSIVYYFIIFASLGFDIYGQRQIALFQDNIKEKSKAFWEIFILKSLFTLISLVILYPLLFTIGFGNEKYNQLILLLSIQVIAVPFDFQFLFKGDENFGAIAIRVILSRLIALVFVFAFIKTENDTWIYALCTSLAVFISNLIMIPPAFKKIQPISPKELSFKKHIKPAFFIFLPTLAVTIYSVFDKTMIGLLAKNPDYENGCYEQAYRLNSIILLPVTIISSVFVSRNANEYCLNGIEGVKKNIYFACNYVFLVGVPLIVGNCVLASNLCSWFLGEGYEITPLLLMIMSIRFVSSGFAEVFGSQLFIAIGKEKYPLYASIIAAILNVSLNLFFIPILGAVGAAITTAISEVSVAVVLIIFVAKEKHFSFLKISLMSWKYILSAGIMFLPVFFVNKVLPYSIFSFLLLTLLGCMVYFSCLLIFRDRFVIARVNDLKEFIKKIFKKGGKKNVEE